MTNAIKKIKFKIYRGSNSTEDSPPHTQTGYVFESNGVTCLFKTVLRRSGIGNLQRAICTETSKIQDYDLAGISDVN